MKSIKLFNKILLSIGIIFIILILILFILGNIERKGYLYNLSINADNTLKLNNIDIENTKKLFYVNNELDYSSLTNYIFTNSNISKYSYNFRVSYYSKVFRNSDIYGVYLNTNSLSDYITAVEFADKGSPFGILISTKELNQDDKIDNICYKLKLKIFVLLLLLYLILLITFIFIIINKIKLLLACLNKINNYYIKYKKCILILYGVIVIVFLLFIIINSSMKHTSKLVDFELISETRLGYVYKCMMEDYKSSKLFSINEIIEINNTNDMKYYGYSLEITNKPIGSWHSTNIYYTENNTFIISNESTNQNAYYYNIQVPTYKGDKYKITILAKKLSEKGNIFWHLNGNNNFKEITNKSISNDYIVLTDTREIDSKAGGVLELHFIIPQGVTEIKSIFIESLNSNLNSENGYIILTSLNSNINNIEVKYNIKPNINNFLIYLILMILPLIIKYIYWIIFDFIKLISIRLKKINLVNLKNRYVYILFVFLCFLIMPNIIYFLFGNYFDKTNYENRLKAEKPILSVANITNYPIQYEKYFNDYIAFRNELILLKNITDALIFKNIISDIALMGKDNWFFFTGDNILNKYIGLEDSFFTKNELEIAKNSLIHFRDELKKRNIDFVLMICPDKDTIYSEYMPNYIKRKTTITPADKFVDYMMKNTDIKIVYPKYELLKYKDKYELYFRYSDYTHWNLLGAYLGYSSFMKELGINTEPLENLTVSNAYSWDGGFSFIVGSNEHVYIITNYNIKNYSILEGNTHFNSITISDNNNKDIMFIKDSYTGGMYDYIASSFHKSIFIHSDRFKNNEILNNNPDIVVFETVERLFKYRLLNILPSYKIEEINKDLETNSIVTNN